MLESIYKPMGLHRKPLVHHRTRLVLTNDGRALSPSRASAGANPWLVGAAVVIPTFMEVLKGPDLAVLAASSYPGCIINMFGYDFRKGQGIILCYLGAEIAAAAHFPLFLWPIGLFRGCAQAGHGTTTMDLGP
jgi:hypothetical protein